MVHCTIWATSPISTKGCLKACMWDSTTDQMKSFNHKVQGLCEWGREKNVENIKTDSIIGDMRYRFPHLLHEKRVLYHMSGEELKL